MWKVCDFVMPCSLRWDYHDVFSPGTVKTAAIMTGIIFIINAVIDGVILYRIHKVSRQFAGKIHDVVDELSGNIIDKDDVKS